MAGMFELRAPKDLRAKLRRGNHSRVESPCFLGFFSTARVNYHAFLPSDATSGA